MIWHRENGLQTPLGHRKPNIRKTLKRFLGSRFSFKILSTSLRMIRKFAVLCRLYGARHVGDDDFENGILILNQGTYLGERGAAIYTPRDRVIFQYVLERGNWEIKESKFLSRIINNSAKSIGNEFRIKFLDIGANSGLVSRQVALEIKNICDFILVEPIPNHVRAIEKNMKFLKNVGEMRIIQAALSNVSGHTEISVEIDNRGNSSLFSSAMPNTGFRTIQISTLGVDQFVKKYLLGAQVFAFKSDTQGYDAKILSLIPEHVWQKCLGGVVEVWALAEIEPQDVKMLMRLWNNFPFKAWSESLYTSISCDEIENFWLSKSGKSRNLYLSRF